MKEINGTVTLAFVEEDNKQKVIFRVVPLATKEGFVFRLNQQDFPDEGSLRIVPDKREQSTFKERMREINGLCAVNLVNHDGKELIKVRQNRNYAPEQGERNRFAIYSDVICDFAPDGCFEVLDPASIPETIVARNVVFSKDKVLYGPVSAEEAAKAKLGDLHPFGNDQYVLSAVEVPGMGQRTLYWNPEALINLRQRRNSIRKKERQEHAQPAVQTEAPVQNAPVQEVVAKEAAIKETASKEASVKETPAAPEALPMQPQPAVSAKREQLMAKEEPVKVSKEAGNDAAALPIGTRLSILDDTLTFDQQISRLDQGLGSGANLLSTEDVTPEEEEEVIAHFKGTPLVQVGKPITKSTARPESVHHVVERQLSSRGDEQSSNVVDNPIDRLRTLVDYIWQNGDLRNQAIDMFSENETFMNNLLQVFRRNGISMQATAAAYEQFSEIEAERLSLLMQLDAAKTNEKKYREEMIASLSQKKKAEYERLSGEIAQLKKSKQNIVDSLQQLSAENAEKTAAYVRSNLSCFAGADKKRLVLSPVIGKNYAPTEMVEMLRLHLNEGGYGISEDEAMCLLIHLSASDSICFSAPSVQDASRFVHYVVESLGLQSVTAFAEDDSTVEVVSLLSENEYRAPTVSVQIFGSAAISAFGHKNIFLIDDSTLRKLPADAFPSYPIISTHSYAKRSFPRNENYRAVSPASLESFTALRSERQPLLSDGEKWFEQICDIGRRSLFSFSQASESEMRRFIEIASSKVRGGFLAAADAALCHWVVPAALNGYVSSDVLKAVVQGLPKAMMILRID